MTTQPLKDKISIAEAVDRIIEALRSDEGYYISWQANIAVMFQDVMSEYSDLSDVERKRIHEASNEAAKRFLNMFISTGDPDPEDDRWSGNHNSENDLWNLATEHPINEQIILKDNGGSMDEIIGKSAEEVFPEVLNIDNGDDDDTVPPK